MRKQKERTSASFRDALLVFEAALDTCDQRLTSAASDFEAAMQEDPASHEAAVLNWFLESVYRETGAGD